MKILHALIGVAMIAVAGCGKIDCVVQPLHDGAFLMDGMIISREHGISALNRAHGSGFHRVRIDTEASILMEDFAALLWNAGASAFGTNVWVNTDSGEIHAWSSLTPSGDIPVYDQNRTVVAIDLAVDGVRISPEDYSMDTVAIGAFVKEIVGTPNVAAPLFAVICSEKRARCGALRDLLCALKQSGCDDFVLLYYDELHRGDENICIVSSSGNEWRDFILSSEQYIEMSYVGLTCLKAGKINDCRRPLPLAVSENAKSSAVFDTILSFARVGGRYFRIDVGVGRPVTMVYDMGNANATKAGHADSVDVYASRDCMPVADAGTTNLVVYGDFQGIDIQRKAAAAILARPSLRVHVNRNGDSKFGGFMTLLRACRDSGMDSLAFDIVFEQGCSGGQIL